MKYPIPEKIPLKKREWLDRELTIKYICWQLAPRTTLVEPDIEIEKDTYRSYGRNYVSPQPHNY